MKQIYPTLLLWMGACVLTGGPVGAEEAPPAIQQLARTELVSLGTDPVIVAAVKAQNAKGISLERIQELDATWQKTAGVADFMRELMESECGQHLQQLQEKAGYYAEVFVMDKLGANVCMTNKTSDYWQGDEDKFRNSYKGGSGGVFVDEVRFDESSQTYLVQASVPVKDGDKVIGAITIGIDVDAFEGR